MVRTFNLSFAILLFTATFSFAQNDAYFKVEFDAFSPPIKAMLDHLEGKPAKNFMMKDLNGQDIALSNYKGKKVVLWFWDKENTSHLLNEYMEVFAQKNTIISFISLFNDPKSEVPEGAMSKPYKVLPGAAFLGEAVYDKELGTPRVYLIDEQGIVKMVLPQEYINNMDQVKLVLNNFLLNKIY
jgi:hypothetical protein